MKNWTIISYKTLRVKFLFPMRTTGYLIYYFMIILTDKQKMKNISKYIEKIEKCCSYL